MTENRVFPPCLRLGGKYAIVFSHLTARQLDSEILTNKRAENHPDFPPSGQGKTRFQPCPPVPHPCRSHAISMRLAFRMNAVHEPHLSRSRLFSPPAPSAAPFRKQKTPIPAFLCSGFALFPPLCPAAPSSFLLPAKMGCQADVHFFGIMYKKASFLCNICQKPPPSYRRNTFPSYFFTY